MNQATKNFINKSLAKPLAITAGCLGLIQGIVWTVLSVVSICCYTKAIIVESTSSNPPPYYEIIYNIFLDSSNKTDNSNLLVKPTEFLIFMCFYVIFSVIWTCVSGSIIVAMINEQWHLTKCLFGGWSATTFLLSLVDITLTSLIARDYARLENGNATLQVLVSYGIVMSLACRGYVLWIVNVIFAIIFLRFTIKIVVKGNDRPPMPIIHGYESNDNNRPWFDDSDKDLWASPAEYDNPGFTRSDSFFPASQDEIQVHNPISNNSSNINESAPSDGNSFFGFSWLKNKSSESNKERKLRSNGGPIIPDPDYTPPNTPKSIKSVLRSKSNYA